MAQVCDKLPRRTQQAAKDARRRRQQGRAVAQGELRDLFDRGALGRDDRRRAHRPQVQQPRPKREAPFEGPDMQHPVRGAQVVPSLKHHPGGQEGAMGMHHGAGLAEEKMI